MFWNTDIVIINYIKIKRDNLLQPDVYGNKC